MTEDNIYNFSTVHGHTVDVKELRLNEALESWEIEVSIYDKETVVEKWTVENGRLLRVNPTQWNIVEYKEKLKPNTYNYVICYKIGDYEKRLSRGTITVKSHKG